MEKGRKKEERREKREIEERKRNSCIFSFVFVFAAGTSSTPSQGLHLHPSHLHETYGAMGENMDGLIKTIAEKAFQTYPYPTHADMPKWLAEYERQVLMSSRKPRVKKSTYPSCYGFCASTGSMDR